ncbi:Transcriptional activator protein acu-15 [Orbilia oligospora]|uniref:Transcriptional activator protein acu-15 n=1 Tax=Orbilia oligospora TaxID=2813651 RepID=A0A7C8QJV3_ORBOL|nr:Transcriptional activator protein acu-15 [Orbilia oligospora]
MPGIIPMKLIKTGNSNQVRVAQACDRCRSKKIRCDGIRPSCSQCASVGFQCKTSDKLSRRAFPRGYTESLEERVTFFLAIFSVVAVVDKSEAAHT